MELMVANKYYGDGHLFFDTSNIAIHVAYIRFMMKYWMLVIYVDFHFIHIYPTHTKHFLWEHLLMLGSSQWRAQIRVWKHSLSWAIWGWCVQNNLYFFNFQRRNIPDIIYKSAPIAKNLLNVPFYSILSRKGW